jgi:hypothetical protein
MEKGNSVGIYVLVQAQFRCPKEGRVSPGKGERERKGILDFEAMLLIFLLTSYTSYHY